MVLPNRSAGVRNGAIRKPTITKELQDKRTAMILNSCNKIFLVIAGLGFILAPSLMTLGFGYGISFGTRIFNKLPFSTLFKIIIPILAALVVILIPAGLIITAGCFHSCAIKKDPSLSISDY